MYLSNVFSTEHIRSLMLTTSSVNPNQFYFITLLFQLLENR